MRTEALLAVIAACGFATAAVGLSALAAAPMAAYEPGEERPGGDATSFKPRNSSAFSQPSATMSFERQLDFKVGDGVFRKLWVAAPASTESSDGLGPIYNARSCQGCHVKDGRGRPPPDGEEAVSLFLRLSIPPQTEEQRALLAAHRISVVPDPTYGSQLQNFGIRGQLAEGRMKFDYTELPVKLADGTVVSLRRPSYSITDLEQGPLHPQVMLSPRVAPPMIGMGFLETIAEGDILAWADPDDRNGDGISGRANTGWNIEAGRPQLGRFGWKAIEPTVRQQVAGAFAGDMGLSSALAPQPWGDCTPRQEACRRAADGNDAAEGVEVPARMLDLVTFYARNLAVPARIDARDPVVLRGKQVFTDAGCAACHRPSFTIGAAPDHPEQAGQTVFPYTDLLLHDMGDGLADHRPEGMASGSEWRTPPLWGLGLTQTVSGHTFLLHDGRARDVLEAILWHGGEAQQARDRVVALPKEDRDALLRFLNSL
jgi:CxxC motif-containing protein (DUF1111 family)